MPFNITYDESTKGVRDQMPMDLLEQMEYALAALAASPDPKPKEAKDLGEGLMGLHLIPGVYIEYVVLYNRLLIIVVTVQAFTGAIWMPNPRTF